MAESDEMHAARPRLIGYWFEPDYGMEYPSPKGFVRPGWIDAHSLGVLLHYLRSAPEFGAFRGRSWCRFQCGVGHKIMGHREFWDGVWVWPEGLAHYVESHDVFLPDEFLKHAMIKAPPAGLPDAGLRSADLDFWLSWSNKHAEGERRTI